MPLDDIVEDADGGRPLGRDTGEGDTSGRDTTVDRSSDEGTETGDATNGDTSGDVDETSGDEGTETNGGDTSGVETDDSSDRGDAGAVGERCGDDMCGAGEDSDSCCEDCGCPDGYVCEAGSCEPPCGETTYTLGNAWVDQYAYSATCGTYIDVAAYMHVAVSDEDNAESTWVPGGYSVELDVAYEASVWVDWQCCYVDLTEQACAGYTSVCEFDDGSQWYCECYSFREQLDGNRCSADPIALCDY